MAEIEDIFKAYQDVEYNWCEAVARLAQLCHALIREGRSEPGNCFEYIIARALIAELTR